MQAYAFYNNFHKLSISNKGQEMNFRGHFQLGILDVVVMCIIVTSLVMLLQLIFGVFHAEYSVMFSVLLCSLIWLAFNRTSLNLLIENKWLV